MKPDLNNVVAAVSDAYARLHGVVTETPLQYHERLSERYGAHVYVKREDQQLVRSYKLRGAYNKMAQLSVAERARGIVCASAGNHAQGVAWSCKKLGVHGFIYMPTITPAQKIERVKYLGGTFVTVVLVGVTFDDAATAAKAFCVAQQKTFVHPFDDERVIAGQGTVGVEILNQLMALGVTQGPDFVVVPVGGGGLVAGLGAYMTSKNAQTKIIGVEPVGAPSMTEALAAGKPVTLKTVDTFVDGASVKTVGTQSFAVAKQVVAEVVLVPEGAVCHEMVELYQSEGVVAEPAGALSLAALRYLQHKIKGKTVVCVLSGGNNDVHRYPDIIARSQAMHV